MKQLITLTVNGESYDVPVEPKRILVDVLRDDLGLIGTKKGCDLGNCGCCTVVMDGKPVVSCLVLAVDAQGRDILTIEGLSNGEYLHPIQQAFIDHDGLQCGFCTPGVILSVKSLLDNNPHPTEDEVKEAISGNLCRCTGYDKIVESALAAAEIVFGSS